MITYALHGEDRCAVAIYNSVVMGESTLTGLGINSTDRTLRSTRLAVKISLNGVMISSACVSGTLHARLGLPRVIFC